jgi:hypothetical protein
LELVMGKYDDLITAVGRAAPPPKYIRAYHASPHDFGRFDSSKIGTGEGHQAYGRGLYFAGREAVANNYRKSFSGGLLVDGEPADLSPAEGLWAEWMLRGQAEDRATAMRALLEVAVQKRDELRRFRDSDPAGFVEKPGAISNLGLWASQADMHADQLRAYEAMANKNISRSKAHMYEVELGVPEHSLMDWDAGYRNQAPGVQESLHKMRSALPLRQRNALAGGQPLGSAWKDFELEAGPREAAEAALGVGIPGIRYLDGGSRSAGQGTHNYVMFPGTEDSIRILRKYGLLAPMAAGAMQDE